MNLFNRFFRKKSKQNFSPMPPWDIIIEIMHDKQLDTFADEVVNVIYSKDHSMRYVVLRKENGLFTYQLETLYQFDEDEWKYICSHDNALPAIWVPFDVSEGKSFFNDVDKLTKEMKADPEYTNYFA